MKTNKKLTTNEFIEKAKKIHGNKYDYSKVEYINSKTKIKIICPIHGEFLQTPNSHLNGCDCLMCSRNRKINLYRSNTAEFVKKAHQIHGDKYDYSQVNYVTSKTKIKIICPEHGEFYQRPNDHLCGKGCFKCSVIRGAKVQSSTKEEFIEKANRIHDHRYDYSQVEYINSSTKVKIICPIHGVFWQTPGHHLSGIKCPKCRASSLELTVRKFLTIHEIRFNEQQTWEWLFNKGPQYADFYLPDYNCIIECQGIQHFKSVGLFGGEKAFKETVIRDENKRSLCEKHGLKVLYFSNISIKDKLFLYPYKVYENMDELFKEISLTN